MTSKVAIIIGATGLVGAHLLQALANSKRYHTIYSIVRHLQPHVEDITQIQVSDFLNLSAAIQSLDLQGADAFITLGTTIKIAKTKAHFYQVDHDFALQFATVALQQGATHCLLLTAMGANAHSPIFYNQVKGQLEQDIMALGFLQLSIFHPSLLLGRKKNNRLGERLSETGFALLNPIMPKTFALRPIEGMQVAKAMQMAAQRLELGVKVYSNSQMLAI